MKNWTRRIGNANPFARVKPFPFPVFQPMDFFRLILVTAALSLGFSGFSAFAQQFVSRTLSDEQGEHHYQVFLPAGYSSNRPVPAILYLHGAGECGTDGRKPAMVGLGPYAKAWGAGFPFLVVFPQAEAEDGRLLTRWNADGADGRRAMKVLDQVQSEFAVDPERVSLVGWSMGGYGAWSLGAAHPDRWNSVLILSGGGNPEEAAALKDVPVWVMHGAYDALVPESAAHAMVDSLREAGGQVAYTVFPNGGHDIFAESFGNRGVIDWLKDPANQPAKLNSSPTVLKVEPAPFVPVLEIPQSVGVRLGNDFLNALSYSIPSQVPPEMLTGRLNDMFDSTVERGRTFAVRFSGISYRGQLERVVVQATGKDRVTVQLGLRNITLHIAGTSVTGARHHASAGPISIGIGHNRAVWLNIDVAPYVENRQLKLRLLGSSFSIPPDTYFVTPPAGISVRGLGMTRERVNSGLVNGLYGARYRVENEVRAIVPNIVRELERQLTLTDPAPMVAGLWPLPVYAPRVRAFPELVQTDANGVSVVMGLSAANYDLLAKPEPVRSASVPKIKLSELQGTSLGVMVAPAVLEPLSQLLIDQRLAHIDLRDLPEPAFHQLADRQTLEKIFPDLKRLGPDVKLRSELYFPSALTLQLDDGDAAEQDSVKLNLGLPASTVKVSVQTGDSDRWQEYAVVELSIQDELLASLKQPSHTQRLLEMNWSESPVIKGEGHYLDDEASEEDQVNSDQFVKLFEAAWTKWTRSGPAGATPVADLKFGETRLRLNDLEAEQKALATEFEIPTIKLTNLSDEPFRYQTKGPYSAWSETYTLSPGESQEYRIPYRLTYRRVAGDRSEVYTLHTGTHSEFRVPLKGGPPQLFTARVSQK